MGLLFTNFDIESMDFVVANFEGIYLGFFSFLFGKFIKFAAKVLGQFTIAIKFCIISWGNNPPIANSSWRGIDNTSGEQ